MAQTETQAKNQKIKQLLKTLSKAYLQRRQYAEALEKLEQLGKLGEDSAEFHFDMAVALIGLDRVDEQSLEIYQKALENNPGSRALKVGLAAIFLEHEVITPFALQVCEQVADMNLDNEQRLRLFLKKAYDTTGHVAKVVEHEQRVIFKSNNEKAIRTYLEKLWWKGLFDEALTALLDAPGGNGDQHRFQREIALTHAYRLLQQGKQADTAEVTELLQSTLELVKPENSIAELRTWILLRSRLDFSQPTSTPKREELEEYQFILGEISLDELLKQPSEYLGTAGEEDEASQAANPFMELLGRLKNPLASNGVLEPAANWEIAFCAQIFTHGAEKVPEKLLSLVTSHLAESAGAIVRQIGSGFISLSANPLELTRTVNELLHHLDEYNARVAEVNRVSLVGGLLVDSIPAQEDVPGAFDKLITATHILRHAELNTTAEIGAGLVYLSGPEDFFDILRKNDIITVSKNPTDILPGIELACSELIWSGPLGDIRADGNYKINRFVIEENLAKHNTCASYLAFDKQLARKVLARVMFLNESIAIVDDVEQKNRLLEQIRAIGRLNHPNIANLYDMGEHKNMFYFVREFVDGKKILEAELDADKRDEAILTILQKIVRALLHAQQNGVFHHNLKPDNIWLNDAQEIKLTDFSCPGFTLDPTTTRVLFPGQWWYLAPERLAGEPGDSRSDIYSIGVIAYELLSGTHPYSTAGSIKSPKDIVRRQVKDLVELMGETGELWNDIVMKAMASDPEKRFANLAAFDLELRKLQMMFMQKAMT